MRTSTSLLALALSLAAVAPAARAAGWQVDSGASTLEFMAVGKPGFLRIHGEGGKVTGSGASAAQGLEGTFETKLDDFHTGIDLRDEHMRTKYLETAKYPTASLHWTTAAAPSPGSSTLPFKGKLKLHGVEKDVAGDAKVKLAGDGKAADVEATFTIKLSDYGIDIPSYLGVTVAEDVEVQAKVHAAFGI